MIVSCKCDQPKNLPRTLGFSASKQVDSFYTWYMPSSWHEREREVVKGLEHVCPTRVGHEFPTTKREERISHVMSDKNSPVRTNGCPMVPARSTGAIGSACTFIGQGE